ncbi:MAG: InlB B-repeat-containing protein, partial [Lachnospiraceae bacterium]|nr:InlB B-repeat-containing protein [Lachnospiraceae bacterium]
KPKPDENPDENPETYNITYSVEGLSGFNAENYGLPTSYTAGTIRALSAPEITGYTFDGWYSDSARTSRIDSISADTTGDVTVYGIATAVSYTISYQVDGLDSFRAADYNLPTTCTYGTETALGTPTITGYTFAGWYSDADHTTGITAISATTTGDVTVYGTATANTYNITYAVTRLDTGAAIDVSALNLPATYTYGAAANLTQIADEDITGFGTFSGWKLDGTTVTAIPADRTGDVALTGTLTPMTYDITFTVYRETEPDGVQTIDTGTTLATWTSTYTYGNAPELAAALPEATDTTGFGAFEAGWFTNTGCTTAAAPAATDSGDKTYYSFLKANRYTITYIIGGDGMEATPEELADFGYADAVTEYFYDPNHDFELTPLDSFVLDPDNARNVQNGTYYYGWYMEQEFTTEITAIPAGYAQDVNLYGDADNVYTNECYANGIIMNGNTNEFYYSYGDVYYYLDTVLLDEYTDLQNTYRYYGVAGSDVRQIAGNIGLQTLIKNGEIVGTVGYDGTVHKDSLLVSPSGIYYLKFTPTRAESAAAGEQPIVPVYLVYNPARGYGGFDGGWTLTEPQ